MNVMIVGNVTNPGMYTLRWFSLSLINAAGGINKMIIRLSNTSEMAN